MFLILSVLLGLAVGFVRKGDIFRLSRLRLIWFAIVPIAFGLLIKYYSTIPFWLKATATTISYLFVVFFVVANRKHVLASIFLALGTLANYLVIAFNSFRMPVSPEALSVYSGLTAEAVATRRADYFIATDGARLLFLGDIIYVPIRLLKGFFSIGDILLAIGVFLMIVQVMGKKHIENKTTINRI